MGYLDFKKNDSQKHGGSKSENSSFKRRSWIEINTAAIENNTKYIKKIIGTHCSLMAVVKADGYGHGAVNVATFALKGGATSLGVATLDEGINLRQSGFDCPILILGNLINIEEFRICLEFALMPTISSFREALLCQNTAENSNKVFDIHLKIDTGMSRLGCNMDDFLDLMDSILRMKNVQLSGIYSHLANASNQDNKIARTETTNQTEIFLEYVNQVKFKSNQHILHLANSAGTFLDERTHLDMVRVGLGIYGYSPFEDINNNLELEPALIIKARISFIKSIKKGTGIGYGHTYISGKNMKIAIVNIGYADGIPRNLSGKITVSINKVNAPQVGAISMDQLMVDVSNIPDAKINDVVTLVGSKNYKSMDLMNWSELSGIIPWELICRFSARLPRVMV